MVESRVGRSNYYAQFNIYGFTSSPHTIYALTHFTIYYSMSALKDLVEWFDDDDKAVEIWSAYNGLREVKEGTIPMEVVEIKDIDVEELPNLRSFYSAGGHDVEWSSSLENMVVKDCPNLNKFGFGKIKESHLKSIITKNEFAAYLFEASDDQLSTITEYTISDNHQLHEALHDLQQSSHFTNLLLFQAKNCDQTLTKFMTILIQRSIQLQVINIEQCKTLRYLFDNLELRYDEKPRYLTQLKELNLTNVYGLEYIWHAYADLRNLQKINIKNCSSLKELLLAYQAKMLDQLKEFKLEACEMLDSVVQDDGGLFRYAFPEGSIIFPTLSKVEFKSLLRLRWFSEIPSEFPKMNTLKIERCPQLETFTAGLTTIYPKHTTDGKSFSELNELQLDSCDKVVVVISSQTLQDFTNLKKLVVSHCIALEMVFIIHNEQLSHSTELLNQLNELILIDLPKLTHIINKEFVKFYQNLQILQVKQCKSLKWIPGSQMLTNMEISDCKVLEKIMIINKEERTNGKAIFSQLKDVVLKNLTNLSIVFPSTSEFPSLETLEIENCLALLTFVEESSELKDHPKSATSNYFFAKSLSLDKLKVLKIKDQHVEKLWHYSCPSESFCELETLTLSNNNKLLSVISFNMIIRFKNLKELTLDKCELLTEVFILEDDKLDDNIQEMLSQLRTLALSNLRGLTSVWNKEPQVPFFSSLVSLFIVHCDSLKSLFSPSSAKNLKKLKLLRLCNCEKIQEVISSDKDENVSIIFPEMECLILKDLPNLVNFCRQSGTIDWPNLQTLRMSNIPSMESFSRADLKTPLLRSIFITFTKKIWLGNLNDTISYIHKNPEFWKIHCNSDSDKETNSNSEEETMSWKKSTHNRKGTKESSLQQEAKYQC